MRTFSFEYLQPRLSHPKGDSIVLEPRPGIVHVEDHEGDVEARRKRDAFLQEGAVTLGNRVEKRQYVKNSLHEGTYRKVPDEASALAA